LSSAGSASLRLSAASAWACTESFAVHEADA
jgi:hypothetical protein